MVVTCSLCAGTDRGTEECVLDGERGEGRRSWSRRLQLAKGRVYVVVLYWMDLPLRKAERVSGCDATHCSSANALHTLLDCWA